MKILSMLILAVALVYSGTASAEEWALKGEWAESCCCAPACPCVFESAPTQGHCEGSALLEIQDGHYGKVEVDGLNVVMTYRIGEWLRLYIDEKASDAQVDAVRRLLEQEGTFGILFTAEKGVLSAEKSAIKVERTDSRIAFSVADSSVELEPMKGPNGKLIRIENLSIPWFVSGYHQYRAVTTRHKRDNSDFSYSGTNGATSIIDVRGKKEVTGK